jgi:uncharacterized protein (TIGR02996 family)
VPAVTADLLARLYQMGMISMDTVRKELDLPTPDPPDPVNERLLRAILVAPWDDGPREAYADYLREHGQALRAEFLQLGISQWQIECDPYPAGGLWCGGRDQVHCLKWPPDVSLCRWHDQQGTMNRLANTPGVLDRERLLLGSWYHRWHRGMADEVGVSLRTMHERPEEVARLFAHFPIIRVVPDVAPFPPLGQGVGPDFAQFHWVVETHCTNPRTGVPGFLWQTLVEHTPTRPSGRLDDPDGGGCWLLRYESREAAVDALGEAIVLWGRERADLPTEDFFANLEAAERAGTTAPNPARTANAY